VPETAYERLLSTRSSIVIQGFFADSRQPIIGSTPVSKRERQREHDVQIYDAYLGVADRLAERGARVERVVLDYDLKRDYCRRRVQSAFARAPSNSTKHRFLCAFYQPQLRYSGKREETVKTRWPQRADRSARMPYRC
jgi:hypothetical protein